MTNGRFKDVAKIDFCSRNVLLLIVCVVISHCRKIALLKKLHDHRASCKKKKLHGLGASCKINWQGLNCKIRKFFSSGKSMQETVESSHATKVACWCCIRILSKKKIFASVIHKCFSHKRKNIENGS